MSFEWFLLLLLFLLLLFFLLFLVFLGSCAPSCGCELSSLTLLGHQASVVLVTGVIPGGLTRGEVEVVDVPCHVLAVGKEKGNGSHSLFCSVLSHPTFLYNFTLKASDILEII